MTTARQIALSPQAVLFTINVYEPCSFDSLRETLISLETSPKERKRFSERLNGLLTELIAAGHIVTPDEGFFAVTYQGLRFLSTKRIAFPRDKHRLYFLKSLMKRRGR